jgi:nifR3 family TIM-barrel protein
MQSMTELASFLNRPLRIGNRTSNHRLLLAPMTHLSHVAFRELVSGFGSHGLLFSEMCSARGLPAENRHHSLYFRWRSEELPYLSCQIFGNDPAVMAAAARRIEREGFWGVDINFGCAAGIICSRDSGAAILKDPERAERIVAAVRSQVSIPLTVKFRTGWRDDPELPVKMALRFERAGADGLVFHPRVAPDRRLRPPRWEYIAEVKRAVKIPVIGNGDVFSPADCRKMIRTTGCDAVAIGRIAAARPWSFAEWVGGFQPPPGIYASTALALLELLAKHYQPMAAMRRFRRFAFYYSSNFRFGHTWCSRVQSAQHPQEIRQAVAEIIGEAPELSLRPNMNFMR